MNKTIDFDIVADLYDNYVQTDFDIAFFKNFCKGYNNILELMCGTGRVSLPLMKSDYSLTCVDYSEETLRVFRHKLNTSKHDKIISGTQFYGIYNSYCEQKLYIHLFQNHSGAVAVSGQYDSEQSQLSSQRKYRRRRRINKSARM